jgi:signal transduction histidine kinase
VLLALALYPATLIVRSLLDRRSLEMFFLGVCFVLSLILGGHDWLVTSGIGYRHNGMLMQFATAPTLATLGVILLRRFVAALRETEALNRDLERRVASKALEIERTFARNRELESSQLLSRERERIMRDMHDGVGSQLIGMLGHLDKDDRRDQELISELHMALHDLRMMIDSLEDVDNDVVVALGLFRNRIQPQLDAAGLALHWRIGDLPPVASLGPERVLHFLRLMQESVTNCIRHAGARNLIVSTTSGVVVNGRNCVCVTVCDDGRGFVSASGHGRGLSNMRYRAAAADLELKIESSEAGTMVRIGFPLA